MTKYTVTNIKAIPVSGTIKITGVDHVHQSGDISIPVDVFRPLIFAIIDGIDVESMERGWPAKDIVVPEYPSVNGGPVFRLKLFVSPKSMYILCRDVVAGEATLILDELMVEKLLDQIRACYIVLGSKSTIATDKLKKIKGDVLK